MTTQPKSEDYEYTDIHGDAIKVYPRQLLLGRVVTVSINSNPVWVPLSEAPALVRAIQDAAGITPGTAATRPEPVVTRMSPVVTRMSPDACWQVNGEHACCADPEPADVLERRIADLEDRASGWRDHLAVARHIEGQLGRDLQEVHRDRVARDLFACSYAGLVDYSGGKRAVDRIVELEDIK
jgi:hypothetical protein